MNLNKELKRKRDAEKRLDRVSPVKVVVINGGGMGDVDLSKYLTAAVEKLNGLQGDVIIKAGDNIEIDIDGNEIEISGIGGPGGITEIPQATETTLGGVKARQRSGEDNEVKIDANTGRLYAKAPDEAVNGVPAGGTAGQALIKQSDDDYDTIWGAALGQGAKGLMLQRLQPDAKASGARPIIYDTVLRNDDEDLYVYNEEHGYITVTQTGWYFAYVHVRMDTISGFHVLAVRDYDTGGSIMRGTQISSTTSEVAMSGVMLLGAGMRMYVEYHSGSSTKLEIGTDYNKFCLVKVPEGGGGEGYTELQLPTEFTLGGIKARPRTTETLEAAVDTATGKLYVEEATGGLEEIPQATESILGGVRARERTTEMSEVAIDSRTGRLYVEETTGGLEEIPQATEYMLGGIKARERLDETNEVKIDSETGKLYTKALTGEGGTDAESILTKEVSVADFSGKDGYILAYDEAQDVFYLKKDDGGEGGGIGGLEVVGLIKMFAQRAVDFMPLVNSGFASPEEG